MSGNVWYLSFSKKKIEFKKYSTKLKNRKKINKTKRKYIKNIVTSLLFFAISIFFSSLISAAEINDSFHINLQTTFSNGSIQTGTFTFAFNITENSSSSCLGPVVYNYSTTKATDVRGIVSIYLPQIGSGGGNLSALSFDRQYYLCYYRDGTLKDVSQLGRVPYSFRATQVNLSEITVDSNLTLGSFNISANAGSFTGNVTASWFKGIFNWIVGTASQIYLSFNGTQLDFNETRLNLTIDLRELTNTTTQIWTAIDNGTFRKLNNGTFTGDINTTGIFYGNGSGLTSVNATTLDGYDSTFFMPLNTSVVGNFSFNGPWTQGGLSITGGDLFAQTIYVYRISSLNVTNLNTNGSIAPMFDNQFDLGNATNRWKDLYVGGNAFMNGTLYFGTLLGGSINATYIAASAINTSHILDSTIASIDIGIGAINATRIGIVAVNSTHISAGAINATHIGVSAVNTTHILDGTITNADLTSDLNLGWVNLTNYPTGCGTGQAVRVIGDTLTCIDLNSTGNVTGVGTANTIAKFTSENQVGNSRITDDGSTNITFNTNNLYINTTNGYVGINTTTPQNLLNVLGNINFTGLIYGNGSQLTGISGGNSSWNQSYASGELYFTKAQWNVTNTSYLMVDRWNATNTTYRANYNLTWVGNFNATSNVTLGTNRFFLDDSSGNVGINTTTPQNLLNVRGDANVTGNLYLLGNLNGPNFNIGWVNLTNYPTACDSSQTITGVGDTITCASIAISESQVTPVNGARNFNITTAYFNISNQTTSGLFYINASTGRVGLGTTTPTTGKLVVSGGDVDVTANKVINLSTPTASTDAATKGYVDAQTSGLVAYTQFTANGTWTKNADAKTVLVVVIGGGGGGGGGERDGGSTARAGGAGGGGGSTFSFMFPASILGSTESITVGAGGAGGAGGTVNNAAAGNGSAGGNTTFGSWITAYGGGGGGGYAGADAAAGGGGGAGTAGVGYSGNSSAGGTGGPPNGGAGGNPGANSPSTVWTGSGGNEGGAGGGSPFRAGGSAYLAGGGGGGAGSFSGAAGAGGTSFYSGAGGGGGGAVDASDVLQAAAAGGNILKYGTGGGGTAGSLSAGGNGANSTIFGGQGGGGGGADNSCFATNGFAGGNGGAPGGGGGGGGAKCQANNGGTGGAGGRGEVRIWEYK